MDAQVLLSLKAGRPYRSAAQLEQTLARGADAKEAARIVRFLVIE